MKFLVFLASASMIFVGFGCSSSPDRDPNYNRGRRQARPMNHRRVDSNALYKACLRERSEASCRSRLGR